MNNEKYFKNMAMKFILNPKISMKFRFNIPVHKLNNSLLKKIWMKLSLPKVDRIQKVKQGLKEWLVCIINDLKLNYHPYLHASCISKVSSVNNWFI